MDSVPQKARLEEVALEATELYWEYVEHHGYDPERAAAAAALEVAEGRQALEALEAVEHVRIKPVRDAYRTGEFYA